MNPAMVIAGGSALLNATGAGSSKMTAGTGGMAAQKNDFLNLLLSQLTNQNPLEPMDNATMVTQMAQFEMVEKMGRLNEKIDVMTFYQNSMNAVNFMDKEVKIIDPDSQTVVTGKVEGIKYYMGVPYVVVNGGTYDVANIVEVN